MRYSRSTMKLAARFVVWILLLLATISSNGLASVALPPGATVPLPGSTAAAEPDLAGLVIHDQLIDFAIRNAAGAVLCRGRLQNRVVRSTRTRRLHFYYRIRDTQPNLPGQISRVETAKFAPGFDPLRVDYRTDGLGVLGPRFASRSAAPGALVIFRFRDPALRCGAESRFFFIKTAANGFGVGGTTRLILTTGEGVSLKTVMPVP